MRILVISFLLFSLIQLNGQKTSEVFRSDLNTAQKPWTHLNFANDPSQFQFAIVTDRTGGPRPGIFEDAVKKLNWLMPEFVMSVGDLIRGASGEDSLTLDKQWKAHFARIAPLKMPFFHLAGNHDIKANNAFQVKYWNRLFGAPFYSYVYKDVLFLALFTNEGTQVISQEQVDYFKKVLEENKHVRWTMVFMHHPLWRYDHLSNFDKMEQLLEDRDYTVFAGHQHRYNYSNKDGKNYYVLATTGGGSPLLGSQFGTFDHITWVTMGAAGPIISNLRLDGILAHDVADDNTEYLTKRLIQSVFFESDVFVDDEKMFKEGKAILTYSNQSDYPIKATGRFYHNHIVSPDPGVFEISIPPHSTQHVAIHLKATSPFSLKEQIQLEFEGSVGYDHPDFSDLQLSGSQTILLTSSAYNVLGSEEVEFLEDYLVQMNSPLPNTEIRYTLDGSNPDLNSNKYDEPFKLSMNTIIKARLIDQNGRMSSVDQLSIKKVKEGNGLWAKVFPLEGLKNALFSIQELVEMEPLKIIKSNTLDPVKAVGLKQRFGVIFSGQMEFTESGLYQFSAFSDDAIRLLIDGQEVLSDPIKHKRREAQGAIELKEGVHDIEIHYYQHRKNYVLDISYISPSGQQKPLKAKEIYIQNQE